MTFAKEVERETKHLANEAEKLAAAVIIEVFASVIGDTPAETGRLRGNWQTTQLAPAGSELVRDQKEKDSGPATSDVFATIRKPNRYFLTNNLPYAEVAEYGKWGRGPGATAKTAGTGFSIQAPAGMVRINVRRVDAILNRLQK